MIEYLRLLESTSKRKEKEDILRSVIGTDDEWEFFTGLNLALDTTKTFGIKKIPCPEPNDNSEVIDFMAFINIIDDLHTRRLTGNAAYDKINELFKTISSDQYDWFYRIITKDLRCGVDTSTVNKILKEYDKVQYMVPVFPYMRCSLSSKVDMDEFEWSLGVISQLKSDGMFVNVNVLSDSVSLFTRNGSVFPMEEFTELEDEILQTFSELGEVQLHGEILVMRGLEILPREIGNGVLNSVLKNGKFEDGDMPHIVLWDIIPLEASVSKGVHHEFYTLRLGKLQEAIGKASPKHISITETRKVYSKAEAFDHYLECLELGEEGTIVKQAIASWRDGTSKSQVKLKVEADCDLVIVGYNEGKNKFEGQVGSLICQSSDKLLEVSVSGFKDSVRKAITEDIDDLIGDIITVRFNNVMEKDGKYSLFLPRFVEFRKDKNDADDIEKIKDSLTFAYK